MNSPVPEHSAPEMGLPHSTPYDSAYPLNSPPAITLINSQHSTACKDCEGIFETKEGIRWRASGVSDTNSWQVRPFSAPCEKSKLAGTIHFPNAGSYVETASPRVQYSPSPVLTKYFIGDGTEMCIAMSGILHVPFTGKLGMTGVAGPTYVTSVPPTVPVVELGSPIGPATPASEPRVFSSSEPQAERSSANDANARKFFMTFSPFLRHSFPHPGRVVKFLFSRRVTRGEKALFGGLL